MKAPHFENVADQLFADMQAKQYRAKAWDRKKHWSKDSTYSIWERIVLLFACLIFAIALMCGFILNYEYLVYAFNDASPVGNWLLLLPCLAFIIWFMIHRQAKKDLKKGTNG